MRIVRTAALAVAALLLLGAGKPNWTATVSVSPAGGHVLGNPDAPVKLVEFVSYTCPHCATFQQQADAPLRLAYVTPGKVSVEVRHLLRDPVDLTVAMLTNCGNPSGFFGRHHAFLYSQDKWIVKMGDTTEAQRKRWTTGDMTARFQAIASDFDFYTLMAQRGYTRAAVNRCLSDTSMAEKLAARSESAKEWGVRGTPSFALNGVLLAATHDWKSLDIQIKARL